MRGRFIADTGPLVALLNGRDKHHGWARDIFASVEPPLATCEAVISEACFLVGGINGGPQAVFGLLERGVLALPFHLGSNHAAVQALMARYASVPMSVADACLVRMAELDPKGTIMTLDGDFKVYRRHGRQVLSVAMPD
jgi:predicted nucleic acid-binding protein